VHVLALLGCHHQGVFTVVKVLSKWSIECSTVTHLQHIKVPMQTQEEPPIKCSTVKQRRDLMFIGPCIIG